MLLTRDAIFDRAPAQLPHRDVKALGGTVRVRAMSALERDEWELFSAEQKALHGTARNVRGEMLSRVIVDEAGRRLFDQPGDADKLAALPSGELDELMRAAIELNHLTQADVEALEGNSDSPAAADDSSSS